MTSDTQLDLGTAGTARFAVALMVLVLSAAGGSARADDRQPDPSSEWRVTTLLSVDTAPFRLLVMPGIHHRHVYHRDERPLFDLAHVDAGLDLMLVPSAPAARLGLRWAPLAALILRADYTAFVFTGLEWGLGHGLTFASAAAPFDSETVSARQGEEEEGVAHRPALAITLRAKLWRVVVQSETELAGWYVHGNGEQYWYELMNDLLIARGRMDGTLMNRSMLMLEVWRGEEQAVAALGAMNEYAYAFSSGLERERLGAVAVLKAETLWGMSEPTLMLATGFTLSHPHRAEEWWLQLNIATSFPLP